MKKRWAMMLMLLTGICMIPASAQIKTKKEIIKEEKMLFINEYCSFTTDEADKFWPLYDEMQDKLKEVRKTMKKELKDIKDKGVDNTSDDDLEKAFDNRKNYEQQLLDIKWEYNDKFIALIGLRKTAKFYEGEIAFRKKLLDRLKDLKLEGDEDEE